MNEDELLRKNLIYLRENRGFSQKELSKKLGYTTSDPVKDWELGKIIPKEKINDIANVFEISSLILQSINLEEEVGINNNNFESDRYFKKIFPFFENKELQKNNNFKKALEIHKKLINFEYYEEYFEKSLEAYKQYHEAYKEGIDEGIINMLSVSCLYKYLAKCIDFKIDDKEETKIYSYLKKDTSMNNLSKIKKLRTAKILTIYNKEEKKQKIDSFIKETTETMINMLKTIRKKSEFMDIYEYYTAVIFLYNLAETGYKKEENSLFGLMYYQFLNNLGNPYVKELNEENEL